MVMIILHKTCITFLVTSDAWNAHDVIGVYNINHGTGGISCFADPAILRFAGTVMGEVGPLTFSGASNTVVG